MEWGSYDYRTAEHYLSALINGDESGMSDPESTEFNEWRTGAESNVRDAGFTVGHWANMADSGEDWGRCEVSGLFAMRCTVRLMVYK